MGTFLENAGVPHGINLDDYDLEIKILLIHPESKLVNDALADENFRRPTPSRRAVYCNEMVFGRWGVGPPLCFDVNGRLIDGQNRLLALKDYGKPLYFAVITGFPPDAYKYFDNGQARSSGQMLKHLGVPDATAVASLIGSAIRGAGQHQLPMSNSRVPILARALSHEMEVISRAFSSVGTRGHATAMVKAAWLRAMVCHPDRIDDLERAASLYARMECSKESGTAILAKLYRWMVATESNRRTIYLRASRAIKAFLDGENLQVLVTPSRDYFEKATEIINEREQVETECQKCR